ncbi:MAG: DUF1343 domain-containing protein [Sulfolobales archaeon]|nr:DUF1343 domain-containing protein [Sulfolobales archaeon]MDW8082796.1 DUF1343 domain-containing protein [Sulfolobales archaeon]
MGVVLGVDRFLSEGLYRRFTDKKLAVLCNQSAVTSHLTYSVSEFKSRGLDIRYVLAPEHGFWGLGGPGEQIADTYDWVLETPIKSIYTREEGFNVLEDVDVVLVDIQDLGVRFYTYVTAVLQTLEQASYRGVSEVVILDRPNPLGGSIFEGPVLRKEFKSYVGYLEMPLRYGLTLGELSLYYNMEKSLGLDIYVIYMLNYSRSLDIVDLGIQWIPPSPAIPDRETVFTYPSLALLEGTNVSEGRGTYTPFKVLGAPFINSRKLCDKLNSLKIPGVFFRPTYFKPMFSKHSNSVCGGVFAHVAKRKDVEVTALGVSILKTLYELYPDYIEFTEAGGRFYIDLLLGVSSWRDAVFSEGLRDFISTAREESESFRELVKPFILYS